MEIPFVGTFLVRTSIAAIAFREDMISATQGATTRSHFVNKLFSSSVLKHNMEMKDNNLAELNPSHGQGGAMRMTLGAEKWLQTNMHISLKDLDKPMRVQSAKASTGQRMRRFNSMKPDQQA